MKEKYGDPFKDYADLVNIILDEQLALQCWKKGIVASDLEAYKGLPVTWILSILDFENKSIYTREMPILDLSFKQTVRNNL